jgi:hypothetical protein
VLAGRLSARTQHHKMWAPTVASISGDSGHAIEDALNRLPDALLAGKPAASVTAVAGGPGEIEQVHSFGVVEPQACRTAEPRPSRLTRGG